MHDDLRDARALLPGVRLDELGSLGGSPRSRVYRVRAWLPDETTLIVKRFVGAGEGWVRESSALSVLPPEAPAARLIAEGDVPPMVIMSDLGNGSDVAEALLGDDPQAASDAVARWAEAVAALHRTTLGLREQFRSALREREGELPVADAAMSTTVDDAVQVLQDQCGRLDVRVPARAFAELRELPRELSHDRPAAISPSDTCPDNNVWQGDRLMLLDFEGAQWRPIAWDVAYLTVPWPTCWCSWRMPGEVAERAFEHYRGAIDDLVPEVRAAQFRQDVALAALGWAMVSTAWFLPRALTGDAQPADEAKLTPRRRALILHRLEAAGRSQLRPALAELAVRLRAKLVDHWGDVPLGYAPAFDPTR